MKKNEFFNRVITIIITIIIIGEGIFFGLNLHCLLDFYTPSVPNIGDFLSKNIDYFNFSLPPPPPPPPLWPIQQFYQLPPPSQSPQTLIFKGKNDPATNTTQTLSSDCLIGELERVIEKENLVPEKDIIFTLPKLQSLATRILKEKTRNKYITRWWNKGWNWLGLVKRRNWYWANSKRNWLLLWWA